MDRRTLLQGAAMGALALTLRPVAALDLNDDGIHRRLADLERQHGGRLGVTMLDTGNGHRVAHRGDQRFLMCSTFKVLAVAAVLARVDRGEEQLDRRIVFAKDAVLSWAPVTSKHVGPPGLGVGELCHAAITVSDNAAANLLLASVGGPAAVTRFVRRLGDPLTRLDRTEPDLNVGHAGDIRDTTTPNAMLATLRKLLLGSALSSASRQQLQAWMRACTTGTNKLRGGIPSDWSAGDKTGSGSHRESNDIAIIWPPQRKPLLVTAYYTGSDTGDAGNDVVLAEVGRIAVALAG